MKAYIDRDVLRIELAFWERVWSFHGSFAIPLLHIAGVDDVVPPTSWREIRFPGTFLPWVIKAGTYYISGKKNFWHLTRRGHPVRILLHDESYHSIIIGFEHVEEQRALLDTLRSVTRQA